MAAPENWRLLEESLLRRLLTLSRENPIAAADELDRLAALMHQIGEGMTRRAEQLRQMDSFRSSGGAADRVQMQVVGPRGEIKQTVDTGARQ